MIRFRKAVIEDLGDILAMYHAAKGRPGCTWNDRYPSANDAIADIRTGNLYVLTTGTRIFGAASVVPENELNGIEGWASRTGGEKELARVVIDATFQGRGFGTELVSRMLLQLQQEGCPAVHLAVAKQNTVACKLYLSLGFTAVGTQDLYENSYILMEKML